MSVRLMIVALTCLVSVMLPKAWAYEFSPIVAQFAPSGAGASRTFVVKNTHVDPIALQIEVYRRSADETGKEVREPEFDDFIITPPQLVLAPGQSQSIRVQWIGDTDPEMELSYRLIVEQLKIPYAREDAGETRRVDVSVGFRYEAALYVVPKKGEAKAEIISSEAIVSEEGDPMLRLTVKNTGERRAILQQTTLTVTSGDQSVQLTGDAVAGLDNRNIIAGTQAIVDLPWPEGLSVGPVSASMTTSYYTN